MSGTKRRILKIFANTELTADVPEMFEGPMLIELDERIDYGEDRWVGIGFLRNGVAVVVWTERQGDVIRIISARKANRYERKRFEQYLTY